MSYFEYIYIFPIYAYVPVTTLLGKQERKWAIETNDELLTLFPASQRNVLKFVRCWQGLTGETVMVGSAT